ncbi:MAG: T9SS type A sorting domain-containing protein [Bacteroidia bacterium]|nr:T9SS type A sorting domain-containing protein [Bacteroidia bacterium]
MRPAFLLLMLGFRLLGAQTFAEFPPLPPFQAGTPVFADADGDGRPELFVSGIGCTRYLHAGQGDFVPAAVPPFAGMAFFDCLVFADADGDGDADAFAAGADSVYTPLARLYLNDGHGQFAALAGAPFAGVREGQAAFQDADGDGDPDVFLSGVTAAFQQITRLYLNSGTGQFTEQAGTPFAGVERAAFRFPDADLDGDPDLLLAGISQGTPIVRLYLNSGTGTFAEQAGTPFQGFTSGSIWAEDADGDGDPEVFISGTRPEGPFSAYYLNSGAGTFTEQTGTPFLPLAAGSFTLADADGDGDPDVLQTGEDGFSVPRTQLCLNNGQGQFAVQASAAFEGVRRSAARFADLNGDGSPDLILTGKNGLGHTVAKVYLNGGQGQFAESAGPPLAGFLGEPLTADADGDGDSDLLLIGLDYQDAPGSDLYLNDGQGQFSGRWRRMFPGILDGAAAIADVDLDGDADILLAGDSRPEALAKLYLNDGQGRYAEQPSTPFGMAVRGAAVFADADGDGDPDLLLTGHQTDGTQLFLNSGQGQFAAQPGSPFTGVSYSSAAVADADGDGDADVLIAGYGQQAPVAELYLNNGQGQFALQAGTPFAGVYEGSAAFADVDGDSDPDLLLTGTNAQGQPVSRLYVNQGAGGFALAAGTPFPGVRQSASAFADVDGDGDADLLLAGVTAAGSAVTRLYLNGGQGSFAEAPGSSFPGVRSGAIAFADADLDGDADLLLAGFRSGPPAYLAALYLNDGQGVFTELAGTPFRGVERGAAAWADANGDGAPDLLLAGLDAAGFRSARLYLNRTRTLSIGGGPAQPAFAFSLFPNPAPEGHAVLRFSLEQGGSVGTEVYDLAGRLLRRSTHSLPAGRHELPLELAGYGPGAYLVRIQAGARTGSRTLLLR